MQTTGSKWLVSTLCAVGFILLPGACQDVAAPARQNVVRASLGATASGASAGCGAHCVLAASGPAFQIAAAPPDTAGALLFLARMRLTGIEGGTVALRLEGLASDYASLNQSSGVVIARIDSGDIRISLREAVAGVPFYRFSSNKQVVVDYYLVRGQQLPHTQHAQWVQDLASVSIVNGDRPWLGIDQTASIQTASATSGMSPAGTSTCDVSGPGPTCYSGLSVNIQPYYDNGNGSFESGACCGPSQTIDVGFSIPVESVTLTIGDPDYAGNTMTAYAQDGSLVDQESFIGDNSPGSLTFDTKTVAGGGITTLQLTAAPNDYVYYLRMEVVVGSNLITLTCTGPVTRAEVISCTAAPTNPASTLTVSNWSFTSSASSFRVDRTANVGSHTWSGMLVLDGSIAVSGAVDGQPATTSAAVSVAPRDWTGKLAPKDHTVPSPSLLPAEPDSFARLGWTHMSVEVAPNITAWDKVISDGGPNDQFEYMADIGGLAKTTSDVNTNALALGSEFYNFQEKKQKTISGVTYCAQAFVIQFIPLDQAHEGTAPDLYPNSHSGIFRRHVDSVAGPRFERFAGPFGLAGDTLREAIQQEAAADSKAMDHDSRNNLTSVTVPCQFHYTITSYING